MTVTPLRGSGSSRADRTAVCGGAARRPTDIRARIELRIVQAPALKRQLSARGATSAEVTHRWR